MSIENRNPLMALAITGAAANSRQLDDKQKSRAMIAAMVLGSPMLSLLLLGTLKPDKGSGDAAVAFPGKDASKGAKPQAEKD